MRKETSLNLTCIRESLNEPRCGECQSLLERLSRFLFFVMLKKYSVKTQNGQTLNLTLQFITYLFWKFKSISTLSFKELCQYADHH